MTNIKEIRQIPSKVKVIKEINKSESDLEEEIDQESSAQFSNFISNGEFNSPVLQTGQTLQETFDEPAALERPKPQAPIERPYDYPERTLRGVASSRNDFNAPVAILKPVHHVGEQTVRGFGSDDLARIRGERDETPYQERIGVDIKPIERKKMQWE